MILLSLFYYTKKQTIFRYEDIFRIIRFWWPLIDLNRTFLTTFIWSKMSIIFLTQHLQYLIFLVCEIRA